MSPGQASGTKEKIKVLILAGSDPVGDWMAEVINLEEGMAFLGLVRDLMQAQESVKKLEPDVVLVDVSSGILDRGDLLNRLSAPVTGASVIVVALRDEVEAVQRAMFHGAQGFLLKPFGEDELLNSVNRAYQRLRELRDAVSDVPRLPAGPKPKERPRAQIIAVYSPKGGVGCTTIAVNLAVALRSVTDQPVILMDGDLRFGDIDIALNINSSTSLATILPSLDELDDELLKDVLIPHNSGIRVLTAPPYVDSADEIEPHQIADLLSRLSTLGEGYVVVDAWSSLDNCTLSILDACQYLVLVTTPQVSAMRDTHRFLEVLNLLQYEPEKVLLVLNHCYHHSTFKLKEVERALGRSIAQEIEHAPSQVATSLNRGVPLVIEHRNSPVARNIMRLARLLTSGTPARESASPAMEKAQPQKSKPKRSGLLSRRQTAPRTG